MAKEVKTILPEIIADLERLQESIDKTEKLIKEYQIYRDMSIELLATLEIAKKTLNKEDK